MTRRIRVRYVVRRVMKTWPSNREPPIISYGPAHTLGDPTAPVWYGRKASTAPWPAPFIKAICTPRADGSRSLTPPTGETGASPLQEALWGLAAVALLGGLLWWALR